jgi:hypothetical protein
MKSSPQFGREYDSSMMFCLDDGAELLFGPASHDEPATAITGAFALGSSSAETRTHIISGLPPEGGTQSEEVSRG